MRLLMLTKYGRLGASTRMRSLAYLPALTKAGWNVTVSPLMSDDYVISLQKGQRAVSGIPQAYLRRMKALLTSQAHDLVWIEKDALPWLPAWVERILLSAQTPYVLDYDDAVFHHYDMHRSALVRNLLGQKHDVLMRSSALVIAGNEYLAVRAREAGARRVELVPTVVDLERYARQAAPTQETRPINVVWIGQRSTAAYLEPLSEVFADLANEGQCRFSAIGIPAESLGLPMQGLPWSEETEADMLSKFDVGIMPLPDSPFERGKCGYKLIQYMACGLPVVASPVGVNRQIVDDGNSGFLASTNLEWRSALLRLATDPVLRASMGTKGRQRVERTYSLAATSPRVVHLLRSIFDADSRAA